MRDAVRMKQPIPRTLEIVSLSRIVHFAMSLSRGGGDGRQLHRVCVSHVPKFASEGKHSATVLTLSTYSLILVAFRKAVLRNPVGRCQFSAAFELSCTENAVLPRKNRDGSREIVRQARVSILCPGYDRLMRSRALGGVDCSEQSAELCRTHR